MVVLSVEEYERLRRLDKADAPTFSELLLEIPQDDLDFERMSLFRPAHGPLMFLIDTDVLSALRRRDRNPAIVRWVEEQRTADLHIGVMTVSEIERGNTQQQRHNPTFARDLAVWLDRVPGWYGDRSMFVDVATARRWGQPSATLGIDSLTFS